MVRLCVLLVSDVRMYYRRRRCELHSMVVADNWPTRLQDRLQWSIRNRHNFCHVFAVAAIQRLAIATCTAQLRILSFHRQLRTVASVTTLNIAADLGGGQANKYQLSWIDPRGATLWQTTFPFITVSVHLCQTKMTTRCGDRPATAKFLKYGENLQRQIPLVWRYANSLMSKCRSKDAYLCQKNPARSVNHFGLWKTQTDTDTVSKLVPL